ncbi:LysR family transcriptional regulator [Paralimibaculum aggregatum]|uniref:LysR family transcriptional regulator n=1 Tax=Paralimibaculum aggregatum TaxID=3036245 RepID=A0ABQ6LMB9_9RHOB|nr:LysR family transcriptional regulator [Limibaculum sp. NKW23]GMG82378.1 LysR family transcriptional regulator [Limibaculum sp. NKW23]
MDWDDLRFFLATARAGGLTEAARGLRTSASTVSRRITSLETALGARLFTRHARGYLLTDEGRRMLDRLEAVEGEITALEAHLLGSDAALSGPVRLAAPVTVANLLVMPELPRLRARHPGIELEIATAIGNVNLTRREADLALRLARPARGRLRVRRVGTVAHGLFGARDYVAAHCPGRSMDEIRGCDFVLWDEALRNLPMARWLEAHVRQPRTGLVTNDLTTQIAAVRAGLGLAVLPCFCALPEDGLVCLIPPGAALRRALYLVMHEEVRSSARVRAVADFLADAMRLAAPRLEGAGFAAMEQS